MVWVKKRLLGSGSYGRVHLAVEPDGNMEIAVKSAYINNSDSLIHEGVFLNLLRGCPYIVPCFGDDRSEERGQRVYNLLLEYAPGGTLRQFIQARGGNLPEPEVARYTYQLLKGIYYMHTYQFVHCDLKPGNVLVFPGGGNRLKLCDLGLAKFAGASNNVFGDCHLGTLLYAPPESVTRKSYEAPKDIWALGCIVVEMLTGKPVWQDGNKYELAKKIAYTKPEIPDDISPPAKDFLKMCLEREPRQRWTAKALLDHPFVRGFAVLESDKDKGFVNPLGCREWSSSRDMVTVASYRPQLPRCFSPFAQFVLFPEKELKKKLTVGELQKQNLGGEDKEADHGNPII